MLTIIKRVFICSFCFVLLNIQLIYATELGTENNDLYSMQYISELYGLPYAIYTGPLPTEPVVTDVQTTPPMTTKPTTNLKTAYVFIGDSRFEGMRQAAHMSIVPDVYVIAKSSKGYTWLMSSAIPQLALLEQTTDYDKYIVICNLGINDLGNLNKYISAIPELQAYATELYWVAINPTIDSKTRVKCRSIENFNNTLKLYFPYVTWIDTYTYLLTDGFNSADGLHYDSATYNKLYYYIMSYVINAEFAKDFPTVPNASQTENSLD